MQTTTKKRQGKIMKKFISLILALISIFSIVSCSCIRGDSKYDYDDLSEYIKLPNFREHLFELEEDAVKQAIGMYLMGSATEYLIQNGDKINVTMKFFPTRYSFDKDNKIEDILTTDEGSTFVIDKLATDDGNGNYTVSKSFEEALIGKEVSDTPLEIQIYKDSTFIKEEYKDQIFYIKTTIKSFEGEGDKIAKGDKVTLSLEFYKSMVFDAADRDHEFKDILPSELLQEDGSFWIESVNRIKEDGSYTIGKNIEEEIIGSKLKASMTRKLTLDSTFINENYRNQVAYIDITINNMEFELGDVLLGSYTGYYLDENDKIVEKDGKKQSFDTNSNAKFYLGSHLFIDDLETGLLGKTLNSQDSPFQIYATFPEDYTTKPELAGKKALFEVVIKSVYTPPAYDDAFVQKYFKGFANVAEFEKSLRREYILTMVLDYIASNTQIIEYPKAEYKAASKQLEEIQSTFYQNTGTDLDKYIMDTYGMTRDAYIKSNMKTEMIYYALRNLIGDSAVPTEEEINKERDNQILAYKQQYMTEGLSESAAIEKAREFVNALGESFLYEEVLYVKVETVLPDLVHVKNVDSPYDDYIFDAQSK